MNRWGKVPYSLLGADISRSAKLLYMALACFADGECKAYPSLRRIAEHIRIDLRYVYRLLRELESAGWVRVDRSSGKRHTYYLTSGVETTRGVETTGGVETTRGMEANDPWRTGHGTRGVQTTLTDHITEEEIEHTRYTETSEPAEEGQAEFPFTLRAVARRGCEGRTSKKGPESASKRPKKPRPTKPLPFSIKQLIEALKATSGGLFNDEVLDDRLWKPITLTIRQLDGRATLEDIRLAGEWIKAGGTGGRTVGMAWLATTGKLANAISQARQWAKQGKPPLDRRRLNGQARYDALPDLTEVQE